MDITGSVALVTGAHGGIGRAFVAAGCQDHMNKAMKMGMMKSKKM
jgi:NAD(P)-dependent dehydrogenase (short-subunit alcohol dehydrogenase family)